MKLRNLLLSFLLFAAAASAQDVITKTDGSKIDAKVEEITETLVRYRKASNPNGPIYSIPLASIKIITYDNGDVEKFNYHLSSDYMNAVDRADSLIFEKEFVTDGQLIKLMYQPEEIENKIKKYRRIGWIGGSSLFGVGLTIGLITFFTDYYDTDAENMTAGACIMGAGALIGAAWWVGFHLKANSLAKQIRETEIYSSSIIQNELLRFDNKSLVAGVSVMGNRMTRTQGLGLSLTYNF